MRRRCGREVRVEEVDADDVEEMGEMAELGWDAACVWVGCGCTGAGVVPMERRARMRAWIAAKGSSGVRWRVKGNSCSTGASRAVGGELSLIHI